MGVCDRRGFDGIKVGEILDLTHVKFGQHVQVLWKGSIGFFCAWNEFDKGSVTMGRF